MLRSTLAALRDFLRKSLGRRTSIPRPQADARQREGNAAGDDDWDIIARELGVLDADDRVALVADRYVERRRRILELLHARRRQLAPARTPARRASPKERGRHLLQESLTPEQWRQYQRYRHFDVIGGDSGKRYRLWHCFQQNIEELDEAGERQWIWCFHPSDPLVVEDVLLAQKTALELFEADALEIARGYWDFAPNTGPHSVAALSDFCGAAELA